VDYQAIVRSPELPSSDNEVQIVIQNCNTLGQAHKKLSLCLAKGVEVTEFSEISYRTADGKQYQRRVWLS